MVTRRVGRADFSLNEIRRDAMQVKLFLASGATEINAIESEINKWLSSLTTDVEVKHVSSAFAGIAPNSSGTFSCCDRVVGQVGQEVEPKECLPISTLPGLPISTLPGLVRSSVVR